MNGATAATIAACACALISSAVTKAGGQRRVVALQVAVQAPGVVLDRVLLEAAVGHALLARVAPAEGRLDAVAGVVGEGQADGAGGRDRQQVRVAQAVRRGCGPSAAAAGARRRCRRCRYRSALNSGKAPRSRARSHRRVVGGVAHHLARCARAMRARLGAVVAQAQHHQRVAQAGEAQADAALVRAPRACCCGSGHTRHVEHVVEHAHGHCAPPRRSRPRRRRASASKGRCTKRVRSIEPRQQQP